MSFATAAYNTIFKRNSVYVGSVFAAAFAFGIGFDSGVTAFWDSWNKGKQWKDIRHRYVQDEESYITLKVDRHVAQADEVLACSNVESSVVGLTKALQIEVGNGQRYI
ncbi:ubiquinol-cytochrome C reductase [Lentinula novae-zelandiae]|nr:ubiquinol-cytochrome C reductase [Lentinula novae-zelandiae]